MAAAANVASTLQGARAMAYTPGTILAEPWASGITTQPRSPALGQSPLQQHSVPVVAIVVVLVILLLLERRRLHLRGRR